MGGGVEKSCVPGGFVVFLFFLAPEERVPKQLKLISIVGRQSMELTNTLNITTLSLKTFEVANITVKLTKSGKKKISFPVSFG